MTTPNERSRGLIQRAVATLFAAVLVVACSATQTTTTPSLAATEAVPTSQPSGLIESTLPTNPISPGPSESSAVSSPGASLADSIPSPYGSADGWQRVTGIDAFKGAIIDDVVTAGPGFVASGSVGGASGEPRRAAIWTSPDGIAWKLVAAGTAFADRFPTYVGLPDAGGAVSLATDGGRIVAVGGVGSGFGGRDMHAAMWTSTDGSSWTRSPSTPTFAQSFALDVAGGGGGFVAVGVRCAACAAPEGQGVPAGSLTTRIWRSQDGQTWQAGATDAFRNVVLERVTWTGQRYLAVGAPVSSFDGSTNCFGGGPLLWSSADGLTWTRVGGLPAGFNAGDLIVGQAQIVTAGATFRSTDGLSWRPLGPGPTIDNGGTTTGTILAAGYFLAGSVVLSTDDSRDVPAFFASVDAVTWSASVIVPPVAEHDHENSLTAAAMLGSTIVVVGDYASGPDACPTCVLEGQVFVAANGINP